MDNAQNKSAEDPTDEALDAYAKEALDELPWFDQPEAARERWEDIPEEQRALLRTAVRNILGSDAEPRPPQVANTNAEEVRIRTQQIVMGIVIRAANMRDQAREVANRALRERDVLRAELRPMLEALHRKLGGAAPVGSIASEVLALRDTLAKLLRLSA